MTAELMNKLSFLPSAGWEITLCKLRNESLVRLIWAVACLLVIPQVQLSVGAVDGRCGTII